MDNIEACWELGDDWANGLTHGLGFILSILGLFLLIDLALIDGSYLKIFAFSVYGSCLVTLYGMSTLYHSISKKPLKHILRIFDHCAIYLLIAGTYTPITLISLQGVWGWTLFATIWTLAITGIILKTIYIGRYVILSTLLYLVMGWLAIVAIEPLMQNLHPTALQWLLAGGIAYTAGVLFFALDRIRYCHTIWHVFVMTGSCCHFLAIFHYV